MRWPFHMQSSQLALCVPNNKIDVLLQPHNIADESAEISLLSVRSYSNKFYKLCLPPLHDLLCVCNGKHSY